MRKTGVLNNLGWVFLVAILSFSCSGFSRVAKNPDIDVRYDAAITYYQNEEYYRAGMLFEDVIPNLIGSEKAEKAQFYFAYCHFHQEQFQLASHYFKSFYDTYRRSDFAEEAFYLHGLSLFKNTPAYNLDQSNTSEAVAEIQEFINRYPTSVHAGDATELIDQLQERLEVKSYTIAKQYHKLRRYKAAVIAYENFQRDYPDSRFREEVFFRKIQAQSELARMSVYNKKKERYGQLVDYYLQFIDRFQNSEYLKEAQLLFDDAQRKTQELNQ